MTRCGSGCNGAHMTASQAPIANETVAAHAICVFDALFDAFVGELVVKKIFQKKKISKREKKKR